MGMKKRELIIRGMRCAGCVATVEDRLKKVPGAANVRVSLDAARAYLDAPADLADEVLLQAVRSGGFEAEAAVAGAEAGAAALEIDPAEALAREAKRRMAIA